MLFLPCTGRLDENEKSDDILRTIVKDYPLSPVANSCRKLLNMTIVDEYNGDSSDSLYSSAENNFINKEYVQALNDFKYLIANYPSSVHIDKAYYGAGWIYENIVNNNDSAYMFYSMLVKDVPNSEAAAVVMQKVEEYENFNKTNLQDTSGTNSDQEIKGENDPLQNNEGNVDPLLLKKELEKSNQDINDPEKIKSDVPESKDKDGESNESGESPVEDPSKK